MSECPRCFWLTQHKVWKRPASIFPSLPSGMDKILKIHFDKFRDRGEIPPELKETECENGFKLFEDKELLEEWRNVFKGVRWTDEEDNIFFGGC